MTDDVDIRDFVEADRAFIMSNWLKSYGRGRTASWSHLPVKRMQAGHRPFAEALLERSRVRVLVRGTPEAILGWCASEGGCLHFVYVRRRLRKTGLGSALVKDAGPLRFFSHPTRAGLGFAKRHGLIESPAHAFYPPLPEAA